MSPDSPRPQTVHQFHDGSAFGDAVTNSLLLTQELLRGLGYRSEIFVNGPAPELHDRLRDYRDYRPRAEDAFLVHHSHGHDRVPWVMRLPGKKFLVYHNITPTQYLPPGSDAERYAAIGRDQLRQYLPVMDGAITVSDFNAQELTEAGYRDPVVLPLLVDVDRLIRAPFDASVGEGLEDAFVVLFVGRVVPNKCHQDVIRAFAAFVELTGRSAELVLAGSFDHDGAYFRRLGRLIDTLGVSNQVRFTGKITEEALYGWYRRADAFLCLSEHEGFGVPLIEAMAFDVPVLAFDSTAVAGTLGGAGVLLARKDPQEIAHLLEAIASDRATRRRIVQSQRERILAFSEAMLQARLARFLADHGVSAGQPPPPAVLPQRMPQWQIEGPFETSYSLALVNRELARALDAQVPGQVALFPTEGPGDYTPRPQDLANHAELQPLWARGRKGAMPKVVVRGLYPPRVHDADGLLNLLMFAWEESRVPHEWVTRFNRSLDGLAVTSEYVKKALIDSGASPRIEVIGNGVDHILRTGPSSYPGDLGEGFRFLHVSSAFPRKGVDVLLAAYGRAFRKADPVTLVLKTFPNIHNEVEAQLAAVRAADARYPKVVLINQDLPAEQLRDLYLRCHALVAPSRGEGFGLPMAEAMLHGLPVIVTAEGGQADFCDDRTAWLVRCGVAQAQTHFEQAASIWFEPDVEDLARVMREVHGATAAERAQRAAAAKALVTERYSWDAVARRLRGFVERLEQAPSRPGPLKLGWVSTFNSKCGIATYSEYLLGGMDRQAFDVRIFADTPATPLQEDPPNVVRCWQDAWHPSLAALEKAILDHGSEVVVIQFNFGFYQVQELGRLLDRLHARGVTTLIFFHATRDVEKPDFKASLKTIRDSLARCDRLLVHSIEDVQRLRAIGLVQNVTLFPHGVVEPSGRDRTTTRQALGFAPDEELIASYGFLLPHKGTEQLIDAVARLARTREHLRLLLVNALYPAPVSEELRQRCQARILELGIEDRVTMITEFLTDDETLCLLEAADVVAFPYQETAESASGAIRLGLASRRPVAVTPLGIFSDVAQVTHRLPGTDAAAVASGLDALLGDRAALEATWPEQRRWLETHAWSQLGERLAGMVRGLRQDAEDRHAAGEPRSAQKVMV